MQSIEKKVISRIYGNGRGWAFSPKNFSDLGTRSSIDVALFKHHESALLVQGLKTLGPDRITSDTTAKLREWLPDDLRMKVIKDTGLITGWIRDAVLGICREEP